MSLVPEVRAQADGRPRVQPRAYNTVFIGHLHIGVARTITTIRITRNAKKMRAKMKMKMKMKMKRKMKGQPLCGFV